MRGLVIVIALVRVLQEVSRRVLSEEAEEPPPGWPAWSSLGSPSQGCAQGTQVSHAGSGGLHSRPGNGVRRLGVERWEGRECDWTGVGKVRAGGQGEAIRARRWDPGVMEDLSMEVTYL